MPGVTSNPDGTGVPQTPVPVPIPNVRQAPNLAAAHARQSVTPIPAPAPMPQLPASTAVPQPPAFAAHSTASTTAPQPPAANVRRIVPPVQTSLARPAVIQTTTASYTQNPRSSPPPRPPMSPITPPLKPGEFPPPRQTHAHSTHPPQTITAPPLPEPIEFDTNPDVLALKSAISILQMQGARAKADMVALEKAKQAALEDPSTFISDLEGKRIKTRGEVAGGGEYDDDSSSEDDDDEPETDGDSKMKESTGPKAKQPGVKSDPDAMDVDGSSSEPKPWATLPSMQNVVRCPPINWGQYAVVGESLDKLHKEQLSRPAQGAPATITPDGRYEFKGIGRQEEHVGIMAPYDPLRDRLEKKPK